MPLPDMQGGAGGPEGLASTSDQAAESSGGISGFFSSLFGGDSEAPKTEVKTQTFDEEFKPPPMPKDFQFRPDEHSR